MNVSSINEKSVIRRNLFINYANSFMSNSTEGTENKSEQTSKTNIEDNKNKSKGIETLTTFTIFPKQIVNGQTIITA